MSSFTTHRIKVMLLTASLLATSTVVYSRVLLLDRAQQDSLFREIFFLGCQGSISPLKEQPTRLAPRPARLPTPVEIPAPKSEN
jgi:hypothetical protein